MFEGEWVNGKRTGHGKMVWQNGEQYTGDWKENLQTGQGEHKFPSGHYDIAGWDDGLRHGPATYFDTEGNLLKNAQEKEGYLCKIPHFML